MQKGSINGADTYLKSVTDFFFLCGYIGPPAGKMPWGFLSRKKVQFFLKVLKIKT